MHQQLVSNYTATVNLINPHGFPLRLEIPVVGYTLDAGTSTGRLLIRGPGQVRTAVVDSEGYTTIDVFNNQYVVNVPADAVDYAQIIEGKPYTWSFDADATLFRLQGDFKSSYDTGQSAGDPHAVAVTVGSLQVQVSFPPGTGTAQDVQDNLNAHLDPASDDHLQYARLSGRAGGQVLHGDVEPGGVLALTSTTDPNKGEVTIEDVVTVDGVTRNISISGTIGGDYIDILLSAASSVYIGGNNGDRTATDNTICGSGAGAAGTPSSRRRTISGSGAGGLSTGSDLTAFGYNAGRTGAVAFGSQAAANGGLSTTSALGYLAAFGLIPGQGGNSTFNGYAAGRYYGSGTDPLTNVTNSLYLGALTRAKKNGVEKEIVIGPPDTIGEGSNTVKIGDTGNVGTYLFGDLYKDGLPFVPDGKRIINSIDDLPTPVDLGLGHGVAYNLEPGIDYEQRGDIIHAYPIVASVPGQSNYWTSSPDKILAYTGAGAQFRSNSTANWLNMIVFSTYLVGDGSNAIFDLDGDGSQSFFYKFGIAENFGSLGSVQNHFILDVDDSSILDFRVGISIFEVSNVFIRGNDTWVPHSLLIGAVITIDGICGGCSSSIDGSTFGLLTASQYAFDIKNTYAGVYSIAHSTVDTSAGGSAFASGSLDHTAVNGSVFSNPSGIPESQYIGSLYMERNTIVTTISEVGQDGVITAFADAGGGQVTVTSAGHGLADGTVVWIVDDAYTGKYTIANVTINTFDITAPYSGPSTGAWETGWVKVEGITYPRENQRFEMAGNNQLRCLDPQERAYLIHCAITPANELVSASKDWEFCAMKNGSIRVRGSLVPIQMTNKAGSGTITAETSAKLGDTYEVYARGLSDTTNLLMIGLSNVIK